MTKNKKIKLTVEVGEDEARNLIAKIIGDRLGFKILSDYDKGIIDMSGEVFAVAVEDGCARLFTKDVYNGLQEIADPNYFRKGDCRLFRLLDGELQEVKAIEVVVIDYVPVDHTPLN